MSDEIEALDRLGDVKDVLGAVLMAHAEQGADGTADARETRIVLAFVETAHQRLRMLIDEQAARSRAAETLAQPDDDIIF